MFIFRTIPTGVGKTKDSFFNLLIHADHPHGRGENHCSNKSYWKLLGPSPRAWGKLRPFPNLITVERTIPTGVGKTPPATACFRRHPDHPHGRGEN